MILLFMTTLVIKLNVRKNDLPKEEFIKEFVNEYNKFAGSCY